MALKVRDAGPLQFTVTFEPGVDLFHVSITGPPVELTVKEQWSEQPVLVAVRVHAGGTGVGVGVCVAVEVGVGKASSSGLWARVSAMHGRIGERSGPRRPKPTKRYRNRRIRLHFPITSCFPSTSIRSQQSTEIATPFSFGVEKNENNYLPPSQRCSC